MAGKFITRGLQLVSVGADGLLKLWSVKTSECLKTFEHHDAKIWALIGMLKYLLAGLLLFLYLIYQFTIKFHTLFFTMNRVLT